LALYPGSSGEGGIHLDQPKVGVLAQ